VPLEGVCSAVSGIAGGYTKAIVAKSALAHLERVALILTRTHHACTIGRLDFSAEPSVGIMRYGSITLKSAVC